MSTTRLIPMHRKRGMTIARCLTDRTNYAKNPDKTQDGEFISSYECAAATVDAEFLLSKREYRRITGREQASDVIAYQLRQSFKPGEVTPEEANRIGYKLALRFTKKRHAFIVATHVDKKHIHNHIIFNSTALDCTRKFRNFFGSSFAIRKLADQICLEHGVSIIENPSKSHAHYGKWLGERRAPTHRDRLREAIDSVLSKKPASFQAFLSKLKDAGYEIKQGKHLSFRSGGQERFIRLRSLGENYSEEAIRSSIAGERTHTPQARPKADMPERTQINLLVDIQAKLQSGKGVGYERWAKKFNIKQMARTLNYLTEHDLLEYDKLAARATAVSQHFSELSERMKVAEDRMHEISELRKRIFEYRDTRNVYIAYRKGGYSRSFYTEHETEIKMHKAAKAVFDSLPDKRVPSIKALQAEFSDLLAEQKTAYAEYVQARKEMQETLTAKANVDAILGKEKTRQKPAHERE